MSEVAQVENKSNEEVKHPQKEIESHYKFYAVTSIREILKHKK